MDGQRFDGLTRALASGTSRRRLLSGGLAAAFAAVLGRGAAEASKGNGGGKPQGRCPAGFTNCRGTCVELNSNPNNCGACATVCSPGENCVQGICQPPATGACPVASTCPGGTFNVQYCSDPNCVCVATIEGTNVCLPATDQSSTSCTSSAECGAGEVCIPVVCGAEAGKGYCQVQGACGSGA